MIFALTIRQPWASAIVLGHKAIENRTWRPAACRLPMRLAIHAGKRVDQAGLEFIARMGIVLPELPTSAILAVVTVEQIVDRSDDPWFHGPLGWVLRDIHRVWPIPCDGQQGLWLPPAQVLRRLPP